MATTPHVHYGGALCAVLHSAVLAVQFMCVCWPHLRSASPAMAAEMSEAETWAPRRAKGMAREPAGDPGRTPGQASAHMDTAKILTSCKQVTAQVHDASITCYIIKCNQYGGSAPVSTCTATNSSMAWMHTFLLQNIHMFASYISG